MTEACRKYGISRKTGYKILKRHAQLGMQGMLDASRAPKSHPNQTPEHMEAAILRVRRAHPTWGSKKILAVLDREQSIQGLPARSTVDAILKRAGLVTPRGRRRRRQPASKPRIAVVQPNDAWSIDYKGWFRVGDGTRCDPLTVQDMHSRASLVCDALVAPKAIDVRYRLVIAFRSFGLPSCMLSDGGPPFGSTGLGRLSTLSVWLVRQGVIPILIEPGRPDQNGRHERFHETLKQETALPPRRSIRAQQRAFDEFQRVYNCDRPHEALAMKTPAEVYELSAREFVDRPPPHSYPDGFEPRSVRTDGMIKWGGKFVFVGEAFRGEVIGLREAGDGLWSVHLGPLWLGNLHERSRTIVPLENGVTYVPGHGALRFEA
ncbi:MAG: transposase [Planctomycetes bacterium]|nr:transposase [Planctomycetota bacterium]MCB9892103.1 transposase [Planctomycetota bacterium]MCB9918977.1 transposase [Planctomycetota bacterium]